MSKATEDKIKQARVLIREAVIMLSRQNWAVEYDRDDLVKYLERADTHLKGVLDHGC